MTLLFIFMMMLNPVYSDSQSFFKSIPEVGKVTPTFRNQKIDSIKSCNGAIIRNVKAEKIEVQGKLGVQNVETKVMDCADVIANIKNFRADSVILGGIITANTMDVNVLTIT